MRFAHASIVLGLWALTCFASAELATEATVQGGRGLLCFGGSCVRPLSSVQSHKTPTAPKITRKSFNQGPKKALLAAETELAAETTVEGGRRLLCFGGSCVRPLSSVQSHKTPTAPKITRKSFNTGPKKALLAVETELAAETTVEGGRGLLCFGGSCVRPLSSVQSHKTPTAPKITRKSFNQGPKKALLAAETELAIEVLAESSRKLLCFGGSCVRPLSSVQSHKAPTAPKISRKSFERKMP